MPHGGNYYRMGFKVFTKSGVLSSDRTFTGENLAGEYLGAHRPASEAQAVLPWDGGSDCLLL